MDTKIQAKSPIDRGADTFYASIVELVLKYAETQKKGFLEGLKGLVRFESLSADPAKKKDLLACAEAESAHFKRIGLENVRLLETGGVPIVYGDWLHAPGKPTILIYGHYDVQPADPFDLWKTPPFEATEKNGCLYGRGTDDNKGQHFIHLCAIESYLRTAGRLPVNIKMVLEGQEESGSKDFHRYLQENGKQFACDCVLISDTAWFDAEHPAIQYSLRGIASLEVKFFGPAMDLHSGVYGGYAPNPLAVMIQVLGQLKDQKNRVTIPGFYDDVLPIDSNERASLAGLPLDDETFMKNIGASGLLKEEGFSALECNWYRPTFEINGVGGGYQGEGSKTVIPTHGFAKITMRLVANQDPQKILQSTVDTIKKLTPVCCRVEFEIRGGERAVYVDPQNPFVQKAKASFEKAFGKPVLLGRDGASIPLVASLQKVLQAPVVLAGIGLPDDRIHSPNEKLSLNNFYGGIKAAILTYQAYAS